MNVLVTGGGGFIGGAVVARLAARGDRVRSLARGEYPALLQHGVEVHRGDIAEIEHVVAAARGCDAVVHTAARAGVWGPRRDYERTNVEGTRNIIDACRRCGVGFLVATSSPSVVFDGRDQDGVDESAPYPRRFLAEYPRTKALAEQLVLRAASPDLAVVALRPHLVWGPGDPHLVPRVLAKARDGSLGAIRDRGRRPRLVDSTYVDNAADAHVLALDALRARSDVSGKAYFISNGEPLPMVDLFNRILAAGGLPPVARLAPARLAYAAGAACEGLHRLLGIKAEPRLTRFVARQLATAHWFDLGAAKRDLDYRPRVSLDEGFRRLADWLRRAPVPAAVRS